MQQGMPRYTVYEESKEVRMKPKKAVLRIRIYSGSRSGSSFEFSEFRFQPILIKFIWKR